MEHRGLEGGVADAERTPAVFTSLVEEYAAYARRTRDIAEDTVRAQRLYLGRLFAALGVSSREELFGSLSQQRVRQIVFKYAENHGPGSRRWMQTTLRSFLKFCYFREYLRCDLSGAVPAFRLRRLASVPKGIDDGTVSLLLDSLTGDSPTTVRDRAIVELLAAYGVRGIQVRHLRLDDIDWAGSRIRFRAAKRGKAVVQHLTARVGNSLLAYIRHVRPSTSPYAEVFLTLRSPVHPLNFSGSLSSIIASRLQRIGARLPEGVSHGTHAFRHAFASRLVGQVPLKHIADMLGHRDMSSSFTYSKVDFKALRETALPWPKEVTK